MSIGAYLGMLGSLGLVLLLLGLALAALRRFTERAAGVADGLPLQVVQRLALGPKQGIAVVRIGGRVVAVSMGEGGVRPLMELDDADAESAFAALAARPSAGIPELERITRHPALVGALQAVRGWSSRRAAQGAAPASEGEQAPRPGFAGVLARAMRAAPAVVLLAGALAILAAALPSAAVAQTAAAAPGFDASQADTMISRLAPQIDLQVGQPNEGGLRLSGTVGVVVMMGLLTLLPTLLLMMTSFTRILVVLHFLRQALGTQSAPPAHLMAALALLLTGFVMAPTFSEVNRTALQPWMEGAMEQGEMLQVGAQPFREFMLEQTRERDLATFLEMRDEPLPGTVEEIPLVVIVSAFVTSELRTAFQIGFALFLPFIIIDVVVASVLMSMGMFMLPPAMISLPFKLLLFVLVDGWSLIVQGLVSSFRF
jgi:flagellar biosynthesis protein FliP